MKPEKITAILILALVTLLAVRAESYKTIIDSETGEKLMSRTDESFNGHTTVQLDYTEGELTGKRKRDEGYRDGERVSTTLYF